MYLLQTKRFRLLHYQPGTLPIVLLLAIGCLIYSTTAGLIIGGIGVAMLISLAATGHFRTQIYGRGDLTYFQIKEGPEGVKTSSGKALDHFGPTQVHLYSLVPIPPENRLSVPYRETDEREDD